MIGRPAPLIGGESETSNHDPARRDRRDGWVGPSSGRQITGEPLGDESDLPTRAKWRALQRRQPSAPQNEVDTADIVRDAIYRS